MLTGSLSSSSSDNKSLKQQFIDAIEKFERIGTSSDNVGGGGDELVVEFRECAERVRLLSLYSSNESLQEMGNERLRFLLVDAYLGLALQQCSTTSPHSTNDRLATLKSAEDSLTAFLTRCADYQLLDASCDDKDNKTLLHLLNLEHLLNNNSNGEEEHDTSDDKSSNAFKLDPSTARLLKIARFKRQRQLKESIQMLALKLQRNRSTTSTKATTSSSDTIDDKNNNDNSNTAHNDDNDDDDEIERKLLLNTLHLMVDKSLDEIRNIRDEQQLLKSMPPPRQRPLTNNSKSSDHDDTSLRLDQRDGPLLTGDGKPLRPFVITSKSRAELQRQVFRPGHNLPTMTIDEYLDIQREQGNILSGGANAGEASASASALVDDMDELALDADTLKKRAFDDFKDDNPRGWGNTMVNRG